MYQCTFCNKTVGPRVSCKKYITSKHHQHPYRQKVQKNWVKDEKTNRMKLEWTDDIGGMGTQVVQEYPICEQCNKNIPSLS